MRLADLITAPAFPGILTGDAGTAISALTADSRAVRPGTLFAALPGVKMDGHSYIPAALAAGASALLVKADWDGEAPVPVIRSAEPRLALAWMAAAFHSAMPAHIAAVTGTNGKTSTAVFFRQIWGQLGQRAASIGTLGLTGPDFETYEGLTTPDPVTLHRYLAEAAGQGCAYTCMEASSHGLDQFRLDAVPVEAAAFTNLTRDHLDYHKTVEAYFAAKAGLFTRVLKAGGIAVLNADIPEFPTLKRLTEEAGRRVWSFGRNGTTLRLTDRSIHTGGQTLSLEVMGVTHTVDLPLVGEFQAMNALTALGLVLATGGAPAAAVDALNHLTGVPGRLEKAGQRRNGASVYVDYSHTPDSLINVLTAVRPHASGRVIVVFGCGGDRDPGKRPLMGEAAARYADVQILTDDNPRSEDPATIRAAARPGCPDAIEIGDRRAAIFAAVDMLQEGDVLVIAGKGHEDGQIVGTVTLPFDDRLVARDALNQMEGPE
ncbi:UDP-N-acetylmuramoyl-L-alanyl-D-glutamate--2,6-diaminopimelate ligase [Novispirillum itersonii]|uniref:UDP-N-acetylmuramoyl-L-alanyl-D-glutamate--2,6-diaminopimelate ligase n=1 Tax=Novispirillum itersonii TaxID=189 RepID=A0A7X0DMT4_NOVIT|nr:UDP-N-acetylmuramoyl-L-alanyl-D-glutamate--2,6-diaminopimelate ligase [Novispirillum itersonii]MBB6209522.1 UDP-N-acetylmuramoyl-L-alanyl-D-glutamate--2,6-diaminopimelate ligase [Novispirillum itersonii]